jgi:glucose-6-phosphate isomerase
LPASGAGATADEIAGPLGIDPEDAWHMACHLAANGKAKVGAEGETPALDRFFAV